MNSRWRSRTWSTALLDTSITFCVLAKLDEGLFTSFWFLAIYRNKCFCSLLSSPIFDLIIMAFCCSFMTLALCSLLFFSLLESASSAANRVSDRYSVLVVLFMNKMPLLLDADCKDVCIGQWSMVHGNGVYLWIVQLNYLNEYEKMIK